MNHGLRGQAAKGDALFVKQLSSRMRVNYVERHARVRSMAMRKGISLEMAARESRYRFFQKTATTLATGRRPVVLATAHTANDQAETLLLRLTRGAGSTGLGAIARKRLIGGLLTIRPFLDMGREEITDFLRREGIHWREDESNRDDAFLRNRVRHEVLPLLRDRLNPNVRGALTRAAEILREEDAWMAGLSEKMYQECRETGEKLQVLLLKAYPPAARRRVLRHWLQRAGIADASGDFRLVEEIEQMILGRRGSSRVQLGQGHDVVRTGGSLAIVERNTDLAPAMPFRSRIALSGETLLDPPGIRVMASAGSEVLRPKPPGAGVLPAKATLNRDAIGRKAVHVRSWIPGDRMRPLGLRGSVKLQDVFVNAKIPRGERGAVPLFVCGNDIIWVPGYRVAQGWEVRATTDRILELSIERT
jgi:tRNA(Ile)-lysidine synthase